jgi:hypothetical protein
MYVGTVCGFPYKCVVHQKYRTLSNRLPKADANTGTQKKFANFEQPLKCKSGLRKCSQDPTLTIIMMMMMPVFPPKQSS